MHLHPLVLGDRIENCILVYSDYGDRDGAISVMVGRTDTSLYSELKHSILVAEFLARHPKFDQKFVYADKCWPSFEKKEFCVALFKFRHGRKIKTKANLTFYG